MLKQWAFHASEEQPSVGLQSSDLIPDVALRPGDPDRFAHAPIAARLSELALLADTPLSIALFGPWGSGKTSISELLGRCLAGRKARLVRYDAWSYVGESLRRSFISSTATALGFPGNKKKWSRYHRGLYEKRRTIDISFGRMGRSLLAAFLLAAVLVAIISVGWASIDGVRAAFADTSFEQAFRDSFRKRLSTIAVGGVAFALAKLVLDSARVDIEQTAPSADEEFAATFRDLVELARRKDQELRLVFFIDELDRCPANEVVETLTSVRTFLSQPGCVFIVAADRAVLEVALDELPQSAPENYDAPYYSSTSSFLDKVFQHQFVLPPSRPRHLTQFARELVTRRQGVWHLLASSDEGSLLEDVLVGLLPSHVQSPRRIKVLLNNFALNFRMAEARGLPALTRAAEIAKLTALQTEFPLIAARLAEEPRLPRLLIDKSAATTDTSRALLSQLLPETKEEKESSKGITDRLLTASDTRGRLGAVQLQQLRRFLQRTARYPDPSLDLIYLQAAASQLDEEDPALGDYVELVATDSPDEVIERIMGRPIDVQIRSLQLLAELIGEVYGDERNNVMTVLAGVAASIAEPSPEMLSPYAPVVDAYLLDRALESPQLTGALRIAAAAEGAAGGPLTYRLLEHDDFLAYVDEFRPVIGGWAAYYNGRARELLLSRVQQRLREARPEPLEAVLKQTPPGPLLLLLSQDLGQLLTDHLRLLSEDSSEIRAFAQWLLEAAHAREIGAEEITMKLIVLLAATGDDSAYAVSHEALATLNAAG